MSKDESSIRQSGIITPSTSGNPSTSSSSFGLATSFISTSSLTSTSPSSFSSTIPTSISNAPRSVTTHSLTPPSSDDNNTSTQISSTSSPGVTSTPSSIAVSSAPSPDSTEVSSAATSSSGTDTTPSVSLTTSSQDPSSSSVASNNFLGTGSASTDTSTSSQADIPSTSPAAISTASATPTQSSISSETSAASTAPAATSFSPSPSPPSPAPTSNSSFSATRSSVTDSITTTSLATSSRDSSSSSPTSNNFLQTGQPTQSIASSQTNIPSTPVTPVSATPTQTSSNETGTALVPTPSQNTPLTSSTSPVPAGTTTAVITRTVLPSLASSGDTTTLEIAYTSTILPSASDGITVPPSTASPSPVSTFPLQIEGLSISSVPSRADLLAFTNSQLPSALENFGADPTLQTVTSVTVISVDGTAITSSIAVIVTMTPGIASVVPGATATASESSHRTSPTVHDGGGGVSTGNRGNAHKGGTSSNSNSDMSTASGKNHTAAIVGPVVGAAVLLVILLILWITHKHRRQRSTRNATPLGQRHVGGLPLMAAHAEDGIPPPSAYIHEGLMQHNIRDSFNSGFSIWLRPTSPDIEGINVNVNDNDRAGDGVIHSDNPFWDPSDPGEGQTISRPSSGSVNVNVNLVDDSDERSISTNASSLTFARPLSPIILSPNRSNFGSISPSYYTPTVTPPHSASSIAPMEFGTRFPGPSLSEFLNTALQKATDRRGHP